MISWHSAEMTFAYIKNAMWKMLSLIGNLVSATQRTVNLRFKQHKIGDKELYMLFKKLLTGFVYPVIK